MLKFTKVPKVEQRDIQQLTKLDSSSQKMAKEGLPEVAKDWKKAVEGWLTWLDVDIHCQKLLKLDKAKS